MVVSASASSSMKDVMPADAETTLPISFQTNRSSDASIKKVVSLAEDAQFMVAVPRLESHSIEAMVTGVLPVPLPPDPPVDSLSCGLAILVSVQSSVRDCPAPASMTY